MRRTSKRSPSAFGSSARWVGTAAGCRKESSRAQEARVTPSTGDGDDGALRLSAIRARGAQVELGCVHQSSRPARRGKELTDSYYITVECVEGP